MKRDFLESLGLEKEAVDKIMAENGTDIENLKSKHTKEISDYTSKLEQATAKETEFATYKSEQEKKYANYETLCAKSKEYDEFKMKIQKDGETSKINDYLKNNGARDIDVVSKLLDSTKITFKEDKIEGLDDQLGELKKSKSYLFTEDFGGKPKSDGETKSSLEKLFEQRNPNLKL